MSGTELTQEETNERIDQVSAFRKALNDGDEETAADLRTKIKWPAWSLMSAKKFLGVDFIRERGYNTELADRKFGSDWLDKED